MNDAQCKKLCLSLMNADTQEEVIGILKKVGYWDDAKCWRYYDDEWSKNLEVGQIVLACEPGRSSRVMVGIVVVKSRNEKRGVSVLWRGRIRRHGNGLAIASLDDIIKK